MLAEYFKLAWEVNDARKLVQTSQTRANNAGLQAEAFIDALRRRVFTGQRRTILEKIRDEAVEYWRRTRDGLTGATMLYHNKSTAAEMCVDLSLEM